MPVSLKRLRDGGASVLIHTCEVCGADAAFGVGVSMRLSLIALAGGDMMAAKRNLGKWYCREHRPNAGGLPT